MTTTVSSLILQGLRPEVVQIEVSISRGIPKLVMIGLADKVVKEAQERIFSCLRTQKIKSKTCRTVINLAPVDVPKKCRHLELGILAGLLNINGLTNFHPNDFFFGSLSLTGEIKSVPQIFALTLEAKKAGARRIFLPRADLKKVRMINHLQLVPINHFKELFSQKFKVVKTTAAEYSLREAEHELTLDDLAGQEQAKRALIIAAAGGHHLLLTGPPGCGKTLAARALQSILPALNYRQIIEATFLHSAAGMQKKPVYSSPPIIRPHHLVTASKLLGGGRNLKPGMVTQAHHGVLFLDEINLFAAPALEGLRQPLTEGKIKIDRWQGSVFYPAEFILIAAQNPCPCGYYGTEIKPCTCSPWRKERYLRKMSGALLDRIDLFINLQMAETKVLLGSSKNDSNLKEIRQKIEQARVIQVQRYQDIEPNLNARLTGPEINKYIYLNSTCRRIIDQAAASLKLSNRSLFKVMKIAQTIADLAAVQTIHKEHLQEALIYRSRIN